MYDVFNVVMICSLDETYWFTCLWNYLLMKRIVGQTGTEVVMSVITMESKQLLYSETNIGNSLNIFSWCALNYIKWHCNGLFHLISIQLVFFFLHWAASNKTQGKGNIAVRGCLNWKMLCVLPIETKLIVLMPLSRRESLHCYIQISSLVNIFHVIIHSNVRILFVQTHA